MQKPDTADGLFVDGNPATGQKGTIVTAALFNAVVGELANMTEGGGLTLDPNANNQLAWLGRLCRHGHGAPPAGTYATWCLYWDEDAGPGDALAYYTNDAGTTWYPCLLVSLDPVT